MIDLDRSKKISYEKSYISGGNLFSNRSEINCTWKLVLKEYVVKV